MLKKLAVIIAIYNTEKYLEECLQSVMNQTYRDLEIICVNDGSTDNSSAILQSYAKMDERIRIVDQENRGLPEARKSGLRVATAEYVAFLDSDDTLNLNCYEIAMKAMLLHAADMVVFDYDEDNVPQGNWSEIVMNGKPIFDAYMDDGIHNKVWNKVWKSESFKNVVFPKGRSIKEDESITAQALANCKRVVRIKDVLHHYRVIPTSLSRKRQLTAIELAGMYRNEFDKLKVLWEKLPERRKEIARRMLNELKDIMMAKVDIERFELWKEYGAFCSENREVLNKCCNNIVEHGIVNRVGQARSYKKTRVMFFCESILCLKIRQAYAVIRNR